MQKHRSDLLLATLLWVASLYILLFDDFIEGGLETDLGSLFLPRAAALVVAVLALFIGGPAIKALRAEHGQSDHVADQQGQPQTEENEGSLLRSEERRVGKERRARRTRKQGRRKGAKGMTT